MSPEQYFAQHPDLAALHIAAFFLVVGLVVGWIFWASNRRQLANLEFENDSLSRDLEAACLRQAQLEQKSSRND